MAIFMYPSKQAKMPTTQTQFTASDATPAWLQQRTPTSVVNSRIQLHDNRLSFYRFKEVCWGPSGCSVVIGHSAAARLKSGYAAKAPQRAMFTEVIERFRDLLEASWSGVQDRARPYRDIQSVAMNLGWNHWGQEQRPQQQRGPCASSFPACKKKTRMFRRMHD